MVLQNKLIRPFDQEAAQYAKRTYELVDVAL